MYNLRETNAEPQTIAESSSWLCLQPVDQMHTGNIHQRHSMSRRVNQFSCYIVAIYIMFMALGVETVMAQHLDDLQNMLSRNDSPYILHDGYVHAQIRPHIVADSTRYELVKKIIQRVSASIADVVPFAEPFPGEGISNLTLFIVSDDPHKIFMAEETQRDLYKTRKRPLAEREKDFLQKIGDFGCIGDPIIIQKNGGKILIPYSVIFIDAKRPAIEIENCLKISLLHAWGVIGDPTKVKGDTMIKYFWDVKKDAASASQLHDFSELDRVALRTIFLFGIEKKKIATRTK